MRMLMPPVHYPRRQEFAARHGPFSFRDLILPDQWRPGCCIITSFFDDLATGRYGPVVRAKALVNTTGGPYRFDCTYGIVDVVRFEKSIAGSRIVVIGEG